MDWFKIAKDDWAIYHDAARISKYVEFNKISPDQYREITDEPYTA